MIIYDSINKVSYLRTKMRREILQILCNKGPMGAPEVFEEIKINKPRYRQSINKALEKLKDSGLVEKFYDENKKRLVYKIKNKKIIINFISMQVESFKDKKNMKIES